MILPVFIIVAIACLGSVTMGVLKRRMLQRDLEELRGQLTLARRQIERQSYIASEIAHDIKNPLTAILCSAEALDLVLGKTLDPTHRRSLHFIHDYGDQVLRLLSDFLDLNRIQAGQAESKKESVQVTRMCESALGLLASLAERQQVQLTVVVLTQLPTVLVDPVHLKQILFNLVHNAIKYSGAGSEISIILAKSEDGRTVRIEVADNGVGIDPDRVKTLFDGCDNFDRRRSGKGEEGLGLGLALCRSLVELEGGTLLVNSTLGKGTIFTFSLPADPASPLVDELQAILDSQAAEESSMAILDGQRILVVDPDAGAREALSDLIGAWGAIVDSVQEAEEALQALSQFEYDSILVDTFLTEEHLERLMPIVEGQPQRRIPRIICAGDIRNAGAHPGLPTVEKPINSRELLGVLLADTLH